MEEDKQVARLWRVNRTIHELVRDRVRFPFFSLLMFALFGPWGATSQGFGG